MTAVSDQRDKVRRAAGWALVGGLSVAALTAIAALLAGDFGDTEWRVILSSLGFAIASAVAASGATQRIRASGRLRDLGTATAVLAGIAFALLLAGLWTDDWGTEGIWRSFGCASVLAIAGSHACVVLGARRRSDSHAVDLLVTSSLVLAAIDTFGGLLPITGMVDEVGEAGAKFFGVTLVLLLLTTLLQPVMRRLGPSPSATGGPRREGLELLAEEVATIAERIEDLARGPALRTPEIRAEAERLRKLARSFQA
jgi:MFS family permease